MLKDLIVWFNDGGPFMWVILGVTAVAFAVMLERLIFYYFICGRRGPQQVATLARLINEKKVDEAKRLVNKNNDPLSVLLRVAVDRYSNALNIDEIREGVEESAIQQVPRLSQRLNYLSLFANVATLLGLLGTITGLQLSFTSLASVEASKKAALLASGISEAMITTEFGLIVAVPCMMIYTFFHNTQNQLVKDLDEAVVKFLNFLKKNKA